MVTAIFLIKHKINVDPYIKTILLKKGLKTALKVATFVRSGY